MNKEVIIDIENPKDNDLISRQAVLDIINNPLNIRLDEIIKKLPPITLQPMTGHCEECKHFRKLPYHADTLGKCFQHTGFCQKGDWYCADYEPEERSGE